MCGNWLLSLGMFLTCAAVILAESAVDGTSSADKSNAITNIVQDVIDSNHDSNTTDVYPAIYAFK